MLIVLLLELGCRKLPLLVIEVRASLGIDSRIVVADHTVVVPCCCVPPLQTLMYLAMWRHLADANATRLTLVPTGNLSDPAEV